MTIKETNNLMKRIKEHYQDFIIDEGKIDEWHSYLKDYVYEDVSKKLDEHLSSEQYGQYIPKVAFLVKYLTKEDEKNKVANYKLQCMICKQFIKEDEFQEHYSRCSSIEYMNNQRYKYFAKRFSENEIKQLWNMNEETFRKKYDEMLEIVKNNTKDEKERERIKNLLEYKQFMIQTSFIKEI